MTPPISALRAYSCGILGPPSDGCTEELSGPPTPMATRGWRDRRFRRSNVSSEEPCAGASCHCKVVAPGRPRRAAVVASLLDLEDAKRVLAWDDDPRCPGKPDIGDAVLSLQARHVILLNLDAA